jgi:hypothetical protein
MKMITVKRIIPSATLPTGNPFQVFPPEDMVIAWMTAPIWTGLQFDLPKGTQFVAIPLLPNLMVVGCGQATRGLYVAIMCVDGECKLETHVPFAEIKIVKQDDIPIRFVENGQLLGDEPKEPVPPSPAEVLEELKKWIPGSPNPPNPSPHHPSYPPTGFPWIVNPTDQTWITGTTTRNPWDISSLVPKYHARQVFLASQSDGTTSADCSKPRDG